MDNPSRVLEDFHATRVLAHDLTDRIAGAVGAAAALSATFAVVHLGREARPLTVKLTALTDRLGQKALFCRPAGEPQITRSGERTQMVIGVEIHDEEEHLLGDLHAVWVTGPAGPIPC
jgi:hypothetical protein